MMWLYAVQFAAPLILVAWLLLMPARSRLGFVMQLFGNFAALAGMAFLRGIWLLPPRWALFVFGSRCAWRRAWDRHLLRQLVTPDVLAR